MKKSQNAAKTARKEFKKQLTINIAEQLKTAVGNIGADAKKVNKAIDKAAKNLAKKLAKQAQIASVSIEVKPAIKTLAANKAVATPAKTKAPAKKVSDPAK